MPDEIKKLLESQAKAFEEFKTANDERLKAMAQGKAVSELEEKTEKINAELNTIGSELKEMAKKMNRPGAPGEEKDALAMEHKEAFLNFMRKGKDEGLGDLQKKAVNIGVEGEGGYAVPHTLDRSLLELLRDESPMRQVCGHMTIGGETYSKLVNLGGATSGWVGEKDVRPETSTPKLTSISPVMGEIYANPAVTQTALDDMFFDPAGWLTREVAIEFAYQEGIAFLRGDGDKKPIGLLAAPQNDQKDSDRPFGTLQFLKTGAASGFPSTNPSDLLIDLIHSLKKGHRRKGIFMLNNLTLATIRKWKNGDGDYLWQPSLQAGVPDKLLGYPLVENEDMADTEAGAIPLIFGDFEKAYTIVDRIGTRVLRDPFTHKPYVHFYTTKRVGGMVVDTNAVKLLKVAA